MARERESKSIVLNFFFTCKRERGGLCMDGWMGKGLYIYFSSIFIIVFSEMNLLSRTRQLALFLSSLLQSMTFLHIFFRNIYLTFPYPFGFSFLSFLVPHTMWLVPFLQIGYLGCGILSLGLFSTAFYGVFAPAGGVDGG